MEWLYTLLLSWLHALELIIPQSDVVYVTAFIAAVTAFIAALIALAPFYKRIALYMYRNYISPVSKFFHTFATLPDRLISLEQKVDERLATVTEANRDAIETIKKELTPNGGTSMKDILGKLTTKVDKVVTSITYMTTQANRMELRQKSILNSVPIPTFETDSEGLCTFGNSAYLDLIGRSMDEIRGTGWKNGIHIDDRELVTSEWMRAVEEGRQFEMSCRVVCRNNRMYRVYVVALPMTGNIGYIGKYQKVEPLGLYVAKSSN